MAEEEEKKEKENSLEIKACKNEWKSIMLKDEISICKTCTDSLVT